MLLMAAGLFSASCTDDISPIDKTQKLPAGEFPLSFTALKDKVASRVTGKTAWIADTDFIGVRFGNDGQIGKYKISDAASGSTVAETPISWTTTTATINAWYPWSDGAKILDISDQSVQEDQSTIDVLIAKAENANYNSDITLTFKHALPQVECTFEANGEGIDLAKLTDVKFLSVSNLKFENGVLSKNADSPVGVKPFKTAERATYSAMIFPEDMSAKEFISVTYDGKEYQFKHDKANFESGKKYTFTIDIKKQAVAQWTVETLFAYTSSTTAIKKFSDDGSNLTASPYVSDDPSYMYFPDFSVALPGSKLLFGQCDDNNNGMIRVFDENTKTLKTLFTASNESDKNFEGGFDTANPTALSLVGNRVYFGNRKSGGNCTGVAYMDFGSDYMTRESLKCFFLNQQIPNAKLVEGVAVNPMDNQYVFVGHQTGDNSGNKISRVAINEDGTAGEVVTLENTPANLALSKIYFSPDGTFAYIIPRREEMDKSFVFLAKYDTSTHTFTDFTQIGENGYWWAEYGPDKTKFGQLGCGTFDNEGNFYLADANAEAIIKLVKSGDNVSVEIAFGQSHAGGADDGTIGVAKLRQPRSISYDSTNNCFYVLEYFANQENKVDVSYSSRIRKISLK